MDTQLRRCRGEAKLFRGNLPAVRPEPNTELVRALVRAYRWNQMLFWHEVPSIRALARQESISDRYVRFLLPLAYLAPDIIEAILDGEAPLDLTIQRLITDLPLDWAEQRRQLGFPK